MKKRKVLYAVVLLLLLMAIGLRVAGWQGEKNFARLTGEALDDFRGREFQTETAPYDVKDLLSLPEPVRKYLQRAMPAKGTRIKSARIGQQGEIRIHDEASFKPYKAVQYVSGYPPRMIWAGDAEHWPFTRLMILTTWLDDKGETTAYLWGLIPAFENRGLEMKAYLMVRWLGEAVWYPTALLPGDGISWEPMTSKQPEVTQARVRFRDGDMTVSGIFTFWKSSGAPFMFTVEDGAMPALNIYRWYCTYSDWTRFGGFQVPKSVTEGVIHVGTRNDRLKITVTGIRYAS